MRSFRRRRDDNSLSSAQNIDSTRLRVKIEDDFEQILRTNPHVGD